MLNHDISMSSSLTRTSSSMTNITLEHERNAQNEREASKDESGILEIPGGSISDRLAALQRSGSENWKKRLGGRPKIEIPSKENNITPPIIMRAKDKTSTDRPHSLLDRIMKLGESQDMWRNRVGEKDAKQFTVAGKMVQLQYSPVESPLMDRKQCSSRPLKFRSKTTNIEQLSSYGSENVLFSPCSPSPLSKSHPSLALSSCSLDIERTEAKKRVTSVTVPSTDDDSFRSFFKTVKDHIIQDGTKIQDEVFEFIASEAYELLSHKRGIKFLRKHAASGNPLKILASRKDIKTEYEEVYTGVAEKEIERLKLEKLAKGSPLSISALAGLASIEDFKSVALKKAVSTDSLSEHTISLIQIKGRRYAQVRLVEPKGSSMSHGDCYVLVTQSQIFCWHGEFSNIIERAKASEVAALIQSSKNLGFKGQDDVIYIDEEKDLSSRMLPKFYDVLSMKSEDIRVAATPEEDELYERAIVGTNAVYRMEKEELVLCKEYSGCVPTIEMLKPENVLVFDFGAEMYVWQGKLAHCALKSATVSLSKQLWEKGYDYSEYAINPLDADFNESCSKTESVRPTWSLFQKTSQHMEPVLFKEKFFDWPNIHPLLKNEKVKDDNNKSCSISEIKLCDVNSMLNYEGTEPDLIIEGSHVGRGVEYHDELERRHFKISTISCKVWHISEYNYNILSSKSWGQFHNCDTYVIRWHYVISNIGRTLKGKPSQHSFVGRKRWAYFFWQGLCSSISEKGASALMTVELNEEKGPHIRVTSGQEPPCFLNLFNGEMVVHRGKREDYEQDLDSWKLFMLRGDMMSESVLVQVDCAVSSLRSRCSFVLLCGSKAILYVWHGSKSAPHSRNFVLSASKSLTEKKPQEIGLSADKSTVLKEIDEGSEPDEFWECLGNNQRSSYSSLMNSDHEFDFTPRMYLISCTADSLCPKEIFCPFYTKTHSCPFPFTQSDLKQPSQPALFLIDNNHEVFLWQGWLLPENEDSENFSTGSAQHRWDVSRRLAMELTLQYCQGKSEENSPKAYAIAAGSEPLNFTNIFAKWKPWPELGVTTIMNPCKVSFVQEVLSQLSRDRYSLQELQVEPRPPGVDPLRLESYLTNDEFEEILGLNKEEFYNLPSWKQCKMKKEKGLF